MEKQKPFVSVIIPTYKRPDTLARAVDSVLNQTYPNVEIIVVDDNNPNTEGREKTEKIMATYVGNKRVKYIRHEYNKNGSAARNTGARSSQAKYLAFLDDDDEFLPDKIQGQVTTLEALTNDWALCYSKYYNKKDNRKPVESSESRDGNLYKEALMQKICIAAGSNLLVRKDAFEEVGGFDESFTRNQDQELLVKLLKKYKMAFSNVPGVIVYVHTNDKKLDYEDIIIRYKKAFSHYISDLSPEDKVEFNRSINETRVIHFLKDKHDIGSCLKLIIKNEVSICGLFRRFNEMLIQSIKSKIS